MFALCVVRVCAGCVFAGCVLCVCLQAVCLLYVLCGRLPLLHVPAIPSSSVLAPVPT